MTAIETPADMTGKLINFKDRETWLASRTSGIGASEIAILFGMAPESWGSPFSLWARKTGRLPPEDLEGEWLEWGQLLEPAIAARYEKVTGNKLWDGGNPICMAQHPRIPIFRCTPDRWVVEAEGKKVPGLLQLKNAGHYMAANWDDGVPNHVQIQEQAEMAVTGAPWADVAVLIGGNKFRHFTVQRDDAFIKEIEDQIAWFWGFVVRDEPPPVDASEATAIALKRLHPLDDGTTVELSLEALDWYVQLEGAKGTIKRAEDMAKEAKNHLTAEIGAATFGVLPDGRRLTYKHQTREGGWVEGSTFRVLKLEGARKKK